MFAPRLVVLVSLLLSVLASSTSQAAASLHAESLRCEYRVNPIGIDTGNPRLSWELVSPRRGERQTAYEIVVASSPDRAIPGKADLWDTGKVMSEATNQIDYAGRALAPGQRAHWRVRVTDKDGRPGAWSAPAFWEAGLLSPAQWKAKWIGPPPDEVTVGQAPASPLLNAQWIWFPEADARAEPPAGERWLRATVLIPAEMKVRRAELIFGVNDRATVFWNGHEVAAGALGEPSENIDLTKRTVPGVNVLTVDAVNTGGPAGFIARVLITADDGTTRELLSNGKTFRASATPPPAEWRQATFDDHAWPAARALAAFNEKPFQGRPQLPPSVEPAPYLQKQFTLRGRVQRARAYVSGLGYFDLTINGRHIGDEVLQPGYTNYDKRVLYVTHDVTTALKPGPNAVGVVLGTGFFNHHTMDVWDFYKAPWRATPRLLFQLVVTYADGARETIVSDESWTRTTGPIVMDGVRNGETFDARRIDPTWGTPRAKIADARPVAVVTAPRGALTAQEHPGIRITQTLKPVAVHQPRPGVFVFDLGQNIAGWARLRVRGPAGTTVQLRYGERLDDRGNLDRRGLLGLIRQGDFQTDRFILAGHGTEVFEPHFTFHGFQYVEVTGFPGTPTLASLDGLVLQTPFAPIASFSSSNGLLDRLVRATEWSYRGNFVGIPTDCPHREKNGWTGDAHLAADFGLFSFDNAPAYTSWLRELRDSQNSDGALPGIVPSPGWGYAPEWSGPSWETALFIIPWAMYEHLGDRRVLGESWGAWVKYLDFLGRQAKGDLVDMGLGDWLPWKTRTPVIITSSAHYYRDAVVASQAARVLGRTADAEKYAALAERIRTAFRARFIDSKTGRVAGDEQTALAVAVSMGLALPGEERQRVADRLAASIEKNGFHLDTGVIGAKVAMHALADTGHLDVAWKTLTQTSQPSWLHWIAQGSTTLWESWTGDDSRNHIFFGDVTAWMYRNLAGLRPDVQAPGWARFTWRPGRAGELKFAHARVHGVRGLVNAEWKREPGGVRYALTVPPGSVASVSLLAKSAASVTEGGKALAEVPDVKVVAQDAAQVQLDVGAGSYLFRVRD